MLLQLFQEYIIDHHLFTKADVVLLAVSGGVDSVVLCDLCSRGEYQFKIAHCNFQLRGVESERDEQFVRQLAKKYGVDVFVKKFDTQNFALEHKISIQVAARELRYAWFRELLNEQDDHQPLQFLLTAHHADDNVETLLMNFFKGTGIRGLQGILPKKEKVIRPLLFAWKEELLKYAAENELNFVEDASNAINKYTRNYFRNVLIPGIAEVFPMVKENLSANISKFRDIEVLYRESVALQKKKLLVVKNHETHIPVLKLQQQKAMRTIVYEIIKDYDFAAPQVDEVVQLMNSGSGQYISSISHRIIKNREWLIITPLAQEKSKHILIEEGTKSIRFAGGKLEFETKTMPVSFGSANQKMAFLDVQKLEYPLILRPWRQGDYFYPFGLYKKNGKPGKKKLSKFFVDIKLSLTQKEQVWVLESKKRIVWVIGLRTDERFKITEGTEGVLSVKIN